MNVNNGYKMRGYVVIQDDDFMQCIGVYNTSEQAYGAAYLFLASLYDEDKDVKISLPEPMEGEIGYSIIATCEGCSPNVVRVLFNEEGDDD